MYISLVNYIFRFIIIRNIKNLRFKSLSKESFWIKYTISGFSFFTKCCLIVLLSANFEFTSIMFNGRFTDFNEIWFQTNGNIIVSTLFGCCFIPIINYFNNAAINWFYRAKDQKSLLPLALPIKTKCRTISEYYEIYAGP